MAKIITKQGNAIEIKDSDTNIIDLSLIAAKCWYDEKELEDNSIAKIYFIDGRLLKGDIEIPLSETENGSGSAYTKETFREFARTSMGFNSGGSTPPTTQTERIIINQSNGQSLLGGLIDSTKEYFLDGVIDMGSTSITIPEQGIYISGYNFDISGLTSSEDNYTLFVSPSGGSGNVLFENFSISVSGSGSQVYDIQGSSGFEAIEKNRINYNGCTSLGEVNTYRQGLETGTGRFGGTPQLTLSGQWLGGYFIDTSIVRGITDGNYFLFKEGAAFTMSSRFRSNQNIDLNSTVGFLDFQDSNFFNPSTLQLVDCLISRNGVFNAADLTIIPNTNQGNISSAWRNNVGINNTFVGGKITLTTESTNTITGTVGEFYDIAGTFTESSLEHFDYPANGQLRHLGDSPREYKVFGNAVIESSQNRELQVKVVVFDSSEGTFVDYKTQTRVVNSLQGGRDVAYFTIIENIILDKDDYVKFMVANTTDNNNFTVELDSEFIVEER